MDTLEDWPHRWFGVWSEFGKAYAKCPSATSFVAPEINRTYRKTELRAYLTSAQAVAASSRWNFPNPFTGERRSGSLCFRTDGKWLWLDDLADYVDDHALAIPSSWLAEIEARNYAPPKSVAADLLAALEWPPTA
jgi:hypothetical protein